VWRLSNHETLDGEGGLRASGRWHSRGRRIVYAAPNPATAVLEVLVHLEVDVEDLPDHYRLLKIDIPDAAPTKTLEESALPVNWKTDVAATRKLGDAWLLGRSCALLRVPCSLVPETHNLLINPTHAEVKGIMLSSSLPFQFDPRLLG